ncbi:hypothetical protein E2562_022570 [Oryza meyeriana var. granulata]|uniref:DUF834 domain-containing protein n=1 Tax=Oryza meyeriana var. granulata TaxID=110450 RepID=A0A6G1CIZ6_9ORYZ|nr:hypothetical protein E2562_022570 [Oryza meyeriana var. granulata]
MPRAPPWHGSARQSRSTAQQRRRLKGTGNPRAAPSSSGGEVDGRQEGDATTAATTTGVGNLRGGGLRRLGWRREQEAAAA